MQNGGVMGLVCRWRGHRWDRPRLFPQLDGSLVFDRCQRCGFEPEPRHAPFTVEEFFKPFPAMPPRATKAGPEGPADEEEAGG